MSLDDDALREHAQRMLAAYRAEEALPDDVRARVRERLSAPPQAAMAPARGRWMIAAAAIAAASAALWWGRGLMVRDAAEAPSSAAFEHRDPAPVEHAREVAPLPTQPPAQPPRGAREAVVDPPEPPVPPAPATKRAPDRPRSESGDAPVITTDALADEAQLLRDAQAALARGDGAGALAMLDAGARRFTAGVLLEERAALHVLALCELGRRARARDEAAAFAAAHPRSPLLARVRGACVDEPAP